MAYGENSLAMGIDKFKAPDITAIRKTIAEERKAKLDQAKTMREIEQSMAMQRAASEAYDPETGTVNQLKYKTNLANMGLGDKIADVEKANAELEFKRGETSKSKVETALKFGDLTVQAFKPVQTRAQAVQAARGLAAVFPEMRDAIEIEMENIPQDDADIPAWREDMLLRTVEASDLLKREYKEIDVGGSVNLVETPTYGRGQPTTVNAFNKTPTPGEQETALQNEWLRNNPTSVAVMTDQGIVMVPRTTQGQITLTPQGDVVGGANSGNAVSPRGGGSPYDTVFAYGKYGNPGKPPSQMTMGELYNFQREVLIPNTRKAGIGKGANGRVLGTSAVGAYQIVSQTLARVAPILFGKDWASKPFSPENQEAIAQYLFEENKNGNLKAIWEGLPDSRPGAYANVPWPEMRKIIMRDEGTGVSQTRGQPLRPYEKPTAGSKKDSDAKAKIEQGMARAKSQIERGRTLINKLLEGGGISSTKSNPVSNAFTFIGNTAIGQGLGQMFGTQNQALRDELQAWRTSMMTAIAAAYGIQSKQLDSNAELKLWLDSLGSPTMSYEARMNILKNIEDSLSAGGSTTKWVEDNLGVTLGGSPINSGGTAPSGGDDVNSILQKYGV